MKKTINTQTYHSLCGDLLLGSFEGKLCLCDWRAEEHRLLADRRLERSLNAEMKDIPSEITAKATQELDEYFAGGRKTFDLPLLFVGTEFQEKVWNTLSIFAPCHRIIGSNGSLTGYGGGLPAKKFLLELEGVKL